MSYSEMKEQICKNVDKINEVIDDINVSNNAQNKLEKSFIKHVNSDHVGMISKEEQYRIGKIPGIEEGLREVSAGLEDKANKNEIFSMANMGQDIKENMTGGSVAVVGSNMTTINNLNDSIADQFIEYGIYDVAFQKGYYNFYDIFTPFEDWKCCELSVMAGDRFLITGWNTNKDLALLKAFDNEGNVIDVLEGNKTYNDKYYICKDRCVKLRFNFEINKKYSIKKANQYKFKDDVLSIKSREIVNYNNLSKNIVNIELVNKNIIDATNLINFEVGGINGNNGEITTANYLIRSTDFNYLAKKCYFEINSGFEVCIITFNSLNEYERYDLYMTNTVFVFNCDKKYKITLRKSNDTAEITSITTFLTNFKIILCYSDLALKTWNCVGDSLTYDENYYFKTVNETLFLKGVNYGVPGSTIAQNNTSSGDIEYAFPNKFPLKSLVSRVLNGTIPDSDIWSILCGTNDWYYGSKLGNINSLDNSTIYGALNNICIYLSNRPNNPSVILFTPTQANRPRYNGVTSEISYEEIRQAIIDIGVKYGFKVKDLFGESGINSINATNYTIDGVHWSTRGKDKVVSIVISSLQELN